MTTKPTSETSNVSTQEAKSKEAAGVLKRSSAWSIDPAKIMRREGWNPRFEFGELEVLAASIKVNGVLNAVRVKRLTKPSEGGHVFELIDGDRRLSAIEMILKKDPAAFPEGIPAIIVDKAQEDLTSLIQMFEANSGKPFLPMEEALAYQRMQQQGMTVKQICAAVGRRATHVGEMLNLLTADDVVKEAVKSGAIGKTEAKQIATLAKGDKAKQRELVTVAKSAGKAKGAKAAVKKALRSTQVERAKSQGRKLKIRALSDAELSNIGSGMAEHLLGLLEAQGLGVETDLVAMIRNDPMLVIAYTTGTLDALKVAAGTPNNLKL